EEFNTLLKEKGVEITRVTKNNVTYRHIEEDKKYVGISWAILMTKE
ncbi:hypothetical protein W545_02686, partial [Staphylococcus aureus VET0275R]